MSIFSSVVSVANPSESQRDDVRLNSRLIKFFLYNIYIYIYINLIKKDGIVQKIHLN